MTDFFEFQSRTKIFSGRGALLHLASEIRLLGGSRAILISDETLKHLGMTDKIVAVLREDDLEVPVVYTDIPTDSSLKTANRRNLPKRKDRCDHRSGRRLRHRHIKGRSHDSIPKFRRYPQAFRLRRTSRRQKHASVHHPHHLRNGIRGHRSGCHPR